MTVRYVIDPKARWSDGYPITATDFEYNWQQIVRIGRNWRRPGFLVGYRDIKSITGSDGGKTVTVVFSSPYSDWEGLFANLDPCPHSGADRMGRAFAGFHASEVISGGPFVVSSCATGKRLVLTRNRQVLGNPSSLAEHRVPCRTVEPGLHSGVEGGSVSIAEVTPSPQIDEALANDQGPSARSR